MSDQDPKNASAKPQDDEPDLLDHAYDGIQEYDNPMPRWWVWSYWASFWFALAYLFHYWVGNGVSVADDYAAEMKVVNAERAEAALNQAVSPEALEQLMADSGSVEKGATVYQTRCLACHLDKGQGSIGPNLTDNSWIHGKGTLMDIYNTVSEGVPAKGMPAWGRQLTPEEMKQVVVFVGTLRGTNIEGKPPQGEAVP